MSTPSTLSHRSLLNNTNDANTPQSAQAQAQLALQHHNSMRGHATHRSEKEKMLAGELYYPNAPELVYERDRCKAALWRFNNSMNPTLGISREERLRLFRDVVQPREPAPSSSINSGGNGSSPQSPMGRVGENVIVEAPFICDYGYNITIARDVLIDSNCTIKDTCSVIIGPRVVIGPNVKLLTATMPIDPRRRKGSQGPSLGRAITIEEDCWIGAGAIIL
jgi:acetyltransferase-like isoleucine patch superfamily enzyme